MAPAKPTKPAPASAPTRFKDPAKWNFIDNLSFGWMDKIVRAARKGDVEVQDLPLPASEMAEEAYNEFNKDWEARVAASKNDQKPPSLMKCLIKTYGKDVAKAGLFKLLWTVFVIMGAYFFTRSILSCIRTLEGDDDSVFDTEWKGWILTGFFFLDAWLLGISLQRMGFGCLKVGIRARAALTTAVARKCYSMAHLTSETSAAAVALVTTDINKVFEGIQEVHYLWGAPIEAATILALLATLVGIYSLPGVAVVCLVVPCQYLAGYLIIQNKIRNSPNLTERYSIVQEILPSMKLIRYYAWERFFERHISEVRKRELRFMFWNVVVKTINITMVFGVPPIVLFAVLVPYELTNENGEDKPYITSTTAFTMLSLFNILRFPLVVLPKALRCVSEALNSVDKLEKFMALQGAPKHDTVGKPGVEIKQAVFQHEGRDDFHLVIPEFSVRPGELVAVVGRVGAGKSSLLQAIMGNMHQVEGNMQAGGNMAYVPQTAWCQNKSLRENILFGAEMDEARYGDVIHACALELDLEILQDGDMSKAGLRGINLSGGQRQRLNLARCAYFGGDLVLLDNALSAVDHHTAQHIFDNCVKGIFRDKATILITHQVEFLPRCDKVAIMDDGQLLYFGPWNPEAQEMLGRYLPVGHMLAAAGNAEAPRDASKTKSKARKAIVQADEKKKERGAILSPMEAVKHYCYEARWTVFWISLFVFLLCQISRQVADYYIRYWTRDEFNKYLPDCTGFCGGTYYVTFYAFWGLLMFVGLMIPRGALLYQWCLGASERLHKKSIHRVLYAPLGFFLQTPIGDLLVAFTKDQDVLDEALPDALYYAGIYGLILCATTVTVSITIPYFSACAAALFIVSGVMLSLYLPASMTLKKLRMNSAGDLVTLVAEALDGLGVIQAYGQQSMFVHQTAVAVNDSHRTLFGAECLNLWLAFYCDFCGASMVLGVSCMGMGMWRTLGSGSVGLAFSQSVQMLVFYTWSIRLLADSISMFGSAERLGWLANKTPQEAGRLAPPALAGAAPTKPSKKRGCCSGNVLADPNDSMGRSLAKAKGDELAIVTAGPKPPPGWPSSGSVEFDNVVMKYAAHLPPALRGVTFSIGSGDKVGVVGRTGSGKSTLLLALYRMFNLEEGSVKVDGVDISTLSLASLRRGLSIIPQEPMVFSGTVRTNLDPFTEYGDDATLWTAIKDVGLEEQVKALGGLDGKVDGASGDWSLGQMQLMCLARAALKKVPVLCLDEATAAMDPHTEGVVISTIQKLFSDRTTLTIAHRLDNVINSDQVIVMNSGQLEEMAPPSVLLANRNSAFSKLVDSTGPAGAQALRDAATSFFQRRAEGRE